jgi:hypothetical protein
MPIGIHMKFYCQGAGQGCNLSLDVCVAMVPTMQSGAHIGFDVKCAPKGWTMDHRGVFCPEHEPRLIQAAPFIPGELLKGH